MHTKYADAAPRLATPAEGATVSLQEPFAAPETP